VWLRLGHFADKMPQALFFLFFQRKLFAAKKFSRNFAAWFMCCHWRAVFSVFPKKQEK